MSPYLKVTLVYLVAGILWIVATDTIAETIAADIRALTFLQTVKGWVFVGASALLIYWLTRRSFRKLAQAEKERKAVFRKTLEGSQHILLNYLNQMQIVTIEAKSCHDFDPEVLNLAESITDTTTKELRNLEQAESYHADEIEALIYRSLRETREVLEKTKPSGGSDH